LFRVVSLNANGIRAAARKGFFDWMKNHDPDVVCIQETKAQLHQLTDDCFSPAGYHCYYEDAVKKGYSGVAIYSKQEPGQVIRGFGIKEFDDEGSLFAIGIVERRAAGSKVSLPRRIHAALAEIAASPVGVHSLW
jgi:exodeoxyribonuclease III